MIKPDSIVAIAANAVDAGIDPWSFTEVITPEFLQSALLSPCSEFCS